MNNEGLYFTDRIESGDNKESGNPSIQNRETKRDKLT